MRRKKYSKKAFLMLFTFLAAGTILSNGNCLVRSLSAAASESNTLKTAVPSNATDDYFPLLIKSGNKEIIFEKMPEKAAVFNYDIAEIMSALGVSDKIKIFRGGHQSLEDIKPQYAVNLKNLCETSEISAGQGIPSLEKMLSLEPDAIIMPSYYFNVDAFGKKEDYESNKIPVYVMEGTYVENCTMENTINDIMNIGRIFRREDKAEELTQDIRKRLDDVKRKLEGKKRLRGLAVDSELNGKLVTWGGTGLANNILTLGGAINVFENSDKQFPHVSWEELVNSDPDFIIICVYGDDESKGMDKIKMLKNNPETAQMKAVKEDKFITIPLFSIFPGLQNIDTIETIADTVLAGQE